MGEHSVTLGSVPLVLMKNEQRRDYEHSSPKVESRPYLTVKTTFCPAASSSALNVIMFPDDKGRIGLNDGGFELS